jgi:hypothetical protein
MSSHGVTHRFLATAVSELHNMENALQKKMLVSRLGASKGRGRRRRRRTL